ncbi:hypothetical protein [Paenarthrobacter ureafaciens]|uniref:hypothetical protein n=1 Tax=Paenarthrobacter ureafaciens TaxID=37931 RepID=UPI00140A2FBA|nr:hypothetical protein [Paenarthrobacter ureafaciens]MCX8454602.1 hypothetical protein [Paenarthrobacter ureafaciens]MCY0974095.1 hypothetical protein [Paenarthrobacter ureafaciens]
MAVETTPLGFKKPDGNDPVRNGENHIADNAQKAQDLHQAQQAQIANLLNAAGFSGDPLALNDSAVAQAVASGPESVGALTGTVSAAINEPGSSIQSAVNTVVEQNNAVTSKAEKVTLQAASDPLAYLDNMAILCQFPVRENGETLWPQGIAINQADNELYVSNADGPASVLRIDVRDLTTGIRKSSKSITVAAGTWTEGLPWFKDGSGNLCFIVRATSGTTEDSTYAIYNYTAGTIGANIAIKGPFKSDTDGKYFITSDAYNRTAKKFFIYDWESIKAGTPSLLATVPIENAGTTPGKTQAVAIVGGYLYIAQGDQASNPSISAYDFTGRLKATRNYAKEDFQAAVNALLPGYLTNPAFVYECEGATNLNGKLVSGQIINNTPAIPANGVMLVVQHNRIDGANIKATPLSTYVYDTGWQDITPASGWTVGGSGTMQVRRIGNLVRIKGHPLNAAAAANAWVQVGTLPAGFGFEPGLSTQFAQTSNTTATMAVRVNPGGTIECWASATTGAWRPLNGISYLTD